VAVEAGSNSSNAAHKLAIKKRPCGSMPMLQVGETIKQGDGK
jgi:hypothetical protein